MAHLQLFLLCALLVLPAGASSCAAERKVEEVEVVASVSGASDSHCEFDATNLLQQVVRGRGQPLRFGGRCKTDTKKKCQFKPCSGNLGPTECKVSGNLGLKGLRKRCQCLPGFCLNAEGTSCVSQATEVKAKVVQGIPPREQAPRLGACLSGGGNRALTWSLGVFRGLSQLGLLPMLEAISSVSGGTWFASLYMYANGTDEALLGAKTEPSQLSLEVLGQMPEDIGAIAVNFTNSRFLKAMASSSGDKMWERAIGQAVLEPFGLHDPGAYLAASSSEVRRIKEENPKLGAARFQVPREDRPNTFVMMGTSIAPVNYVGTAENMVGFQMMPGFIGIPFYPNGSTVDYAPMDPESELPLIEDRLLGGGMVESFAFGGKEPTPQNQAGDDLVEVPAPTEPFILSDAVGISSMATAGAFAQIEKMKQWDPRAEYWPVTSNEFPAAVPSWIQLLGDGGSTDNSGLIALLMRGVERVLWVSSSYETLNRTYPWKEACAGEVEFDPKTAQVVDMVLGKYGYGDLTTNEAAGDVQVNNQVFERQGLLPLSCELWRLASEGKPAVVHFKERVLANAFWGVEGGYEVDLVLVYLEHSSDFTEQLPDNTQDMLLQGESGTLSNFPSYKTMMQNVPEIVGYTEAQVNLLAAQAEYTVRQAESTLRSLFEG